VFGRRNPNGLAAGRVWQNEAKRRRAPTRVFGDPNNHHKVPISAAIPES
jgi:hypothetical protein